MQTRPMANIYVNLRYNAFCARYTNVSWYSIEHVRGLRLVTLRLGEALISSNSLFHIKLVSAPCSATTFAITLRILNDASTSGDPRAFEVVATRAISLYSLPFLCVFVTFEGTTLSIFALLARRNSSCNFSFNVSSDLGQC